MIKRIAAIVAAVLLMIGLAAVPAQAAAFGCPDGGYICFYNYESFNYVNDGHGGIWVAYSGAANVCHVLPTGGASGWTNGKVYNASSSILMNWTGTNTVQREIHFYDSNACSSSDYQFVSTVSPGQLNTNDYRLANFGWNDRIGSWKVV